LIYIIVGSVTGICFGQPYEQIRSEGVSQHEILPHYNLNLYSVRYTFNLPMTATTG